MFDKTKYAKPFGSAEETCPFLRQSCNRVCHKCTMWEPLEVTVNGSSEVMWKCAMKWPVTLASVNNHRLQGLQSAFEDLRNWLVRYANSTTQLVGRVAQATVAPLPSVPLLEHKDGEVEEQRSNGG